MATHSSILAWRIPWTEEYGELQSMELHRVGHDWSDWAHTHALSIYPVIPLWHVEFLLKVLPLIIWVFPCMLLVAFPLLFLIFFFVFNLCYLDEYVFWCVSPWVYPVGDSLHFLDLTDYFLFHVGEIFNSSKRLEIISSEIFHTLYFSLLLLGPL